jgi:hypothetical protein
MAKRISSIKIFIKKTNKFLQVFISLIQKIGAHTKRRNTKRQRQNVDTSKRRHIKTSTITKRGQLQNVECFSISSYIPVQYKNNMKCICNYYF